MIPETCLNCMNSYYRLPLFHDTPMPMIQYHSSQQSEQQQQPQPQQQPSTEQPTSPFITAPGSPTDLGKEYTQGYLKSQIGKKVKIMFLLGTNIIQDREGTIVDVGISYVVIKETETNNLVMCDIYAIKFVTIYQ